jgi:zinc/manganese transport system ATP-binding protein
MVPRPSISEPGAPVATAAPPLLSVEGVRVALGGRQILDGVGFEVGEGEFTGLIGTNGAGKTTLLRVVLGLQRVQAGTVRLEGGRREARSGRAIGYVPQKLSLDPDLPLRTRDLVALGVDGNRYGLRRRSRIQAEAVEETLVAVGAESFADSRVGRLSGGETQRVLIAHALVSRPRLLLLDEPLANLDLSSAQEIVSLLHRVASEHHIAVLLSAHEMNALLPVMDRVVYLAGGQAASGTVDEVIRSDVLSRLYRHRVEVLHVAGRILVVAGAETGAADALNSLERPSEPVVEVL